jgi:antitoxin (DNA-binding transcriptional repressor) of toxin-antitoxin stability system
MRLDEATMRTVSLTEAKDHLSGLVDEVGSTHEIVNHHQAVARLRS